MQDMEIRVKRFYKCRDYTVGRLFLDGRYFCDTLEDMDRGLSSDMSDEEIAKIKVPGKTAVPRGTYDVTLDVVSPRFATRKAYAFCGGRLPRLIDVPGFNGILIHAGNTADDSSGCILVGMNSRKGMLTDSVTVFRQLYQKIREGKQGRLKIIIE